MENENKSSKFHINLWYFIIFSLLGLITETIVYVIMSKTIGARGLYLGPLCFIYGISSVILINALEKLKNKIIYNKHNLSIINAVCNKLYTRSC